MKTIVEKEKNLKRCGKIGLLIGEAFAVLRCCKQFVIFAREGVADISAYAFCGLITLKKQAQKRKVKNCAGLRLGLRNFKRYVCPEKVQNTGKFSVIGNKHSINREFTGVSLVTKTGNNTGFVQCH